MMEITLSTNHSELALLLQEGAMALASAHEEWCNPTRRPCRCVGFMDRMEEIAGEIIDGIAKEV